MDGKAMLRRLRMELQEHSGSTWLDDRLSYELMWEAATEFVVETKCLTGTQTITTTADTASYKLDADFLGLWLRDADNKYYAKYVDGSSVTYWMTHKDYEDVIYANNSTSIDVPSHFSITNEASLPAQITGTATSAGAASNGQCTLTDTAGVFTTTDYVSPGDNIHNTTDTSTGYVISVTSATALVTALFDGSDNDWSSSDAYIIQPQQRYQVTFDPPPDTSSETITIYYVKRPAPVFSDAGVYQIPWEYHPALVKYAAFQYKYRDGEPNYGDALWRYWQDALRKAKMMEAKRRRMKGWHVRFKPS